MFPEQFIISESALDKPRYRQAIFFIWVSYFYCCIFFRIYFDCHILEVHYYTYRPLCPGRQNYRRFFNLLP